MAGKITLYVRDEDLWNRARRVSGPGGLSDMVQRCLQDWLERTGGAVLPAPSPLERARKLRQDVEELVRVIERQSPELGRSPSPPSRPVTRRGSRRAR
jgi:hypothetical protein